VQSHSARLLLLVIIIIIIVGVATTDDSGDNFDPSMRLVTTRPV
jgi:hypothetical protein